jgi:Zn-dependent protease
MENGYLKLGRFGGVPVRVHWTAPLFIVLLSFMLNGFRFTPAAWLGILLLIVAHELGHAAMVRAFRMGLLAIDIRGVGGQCQWYGSPSPIRRALIAWGGVFGQAVVLAIVFPVTLFLPNGAPWWVVELLLALVYSNLYLMAFNLLPIPGFDGAEAWKLFGKSGIPAWWRKRRARKAKQQRGVVRSMPVHKRFVPDDDILEKTPPHQKRPPPHMLN